MKRNYSTTIVLNENTQKPGLKQDGLGTDLLTHLPYTTAKTLLCLDPTELKGRLQPKSVDG